MEAIRFICPSNVKVIPRTYASYDGVAGFVYVLLDCVYKCVYVFILFKRRPFVFEGYSLHGPMVLLCCWYILFPSVYEMGIESLGNFRSACLWESSVHPNVSQS